MGLSERFRRVFGPKVEDVHFIVDEQKPSRRELRYLRRVQNESLAFVSMTTEYETSLVPLCIRFVVLDH